MDTKVTSGESAVWNARNAKVASLNATRQIQYAVYEALQDQSLTPQQRKDFEKAQGLAPAQQVEVLKRNGKLTPQLQQMWTLYNDWYSTYQPGATRLKDPRPYIVFDPNAQDGFGIRIRGLQLPTAQNMPVQQIQYVWQQMGTAMQQRGSDLYLQSDLNAWRQFINLIPTWFPARASDFMNAPVAVSPNLAPSGQTMDQLLKKMKGAVELPKMDKVNRKLSCLPLPGKEPNTFQGIAINFDPRDPILNDYEKGPNDLHVSTGIEAKLRELGFFNPQTAAKAYFNEMKGQLLVIADPKSPSQWERYDQLVKWLESLKYDVSEIVDVLANISPDHYQRQQRQDMSQEINRESTPEEIQKSLVKNVTRASQSAVNFLVKNGVVANAAELYNAKDPLNQQKLCDVLKDYVKQLYPNGFAHPFEQMKEKQAEAIAFGATRNSFVLADEPGSGKTFMACAIADLQAKIADSALPEGSPQSQILVLTPTGLISENWVTKMKDGKPQHAAPKRFIEPDMDEGQVQVIDSYDANGNTPDFVGKWIVVPYNMFKDIGQPENLPKMRKPPKNAPIELVQQWDNYQKSIKRDEMKKKRLNNIKNFVRKILANRRFATVALDESQYAKNGQAGLTQNVHMALAKINRKVAMTGTPADDNPSDLYGQLRLIDHPAIERDGGEQSEKSFCQQFFAGFGTDSKSSSSDILENISQHLGSARQFMEMVCNFFLRRTKDQINPLHKGRNEQDEFNIVDENGQQIVPNEQYWSSLYDKAIQTAAENKVLRQMKVQRDELGRLPAGTVLDPNAVKDAKDQILDSKNPNGPGEQQQAFVEQVAKAKVYTSVRDAIAHYKKGTATYMAPQKDQNGQPVMALQPKMVPVLDDRGKPVKDANGQAQMRQATDANGQPVMENQPVMEQRSVPNKVLILTGSVDAANIMHNLIAQQLGPETVRVVTGGTNDDERGEAAAAFQQEGKEPRILVFTLKLGSVGYNFDVADLCIVNDPPWNPSLLEQAVNRVDRNMGKYKPLVKFNILSNKPDRKNRREQLFNLGIDDKIYQLIDAKGEANSTVQNCLQEAEFIKRRYADDVNTRETMLNQLAEQFVRSFAKSLELTEAAKLLYNRPSVPKAAPAGVPVAAKSWYGRLKESTLKHRRLW
jgi:SNF2 family DNA or RNA helicase